MSNSAAPLQDHSHDVPVKLVEPVRPVEPGKAADSVAVSASGLTTLPDKRPSRRFFGLLPGRRGT